MALQVLAGLSGRVLLTLSEDDLKDCEVTTLKKLSSEQVCQEWSRLKLMIGTRVLRNDELLMDLFDANGMHPLEVRLIVMGMLGLIQGRWESHDATIDNCDMKLGDKGTVVLSEVDANTVCISECPPQLSEWSGLQGQLLQNGSRLLWMRGVETAYQFTREDAHQLTRKRIIKWVINLHTELTRLACSEVHGAHEAGKHLGLRARVYDTEAVRWLRDSERAYRYALEPRGIASNVPTIDGIIAAERGTRRALKKANALEIALMQSDVRLRMSSKSERRNMSRGGWINRVTKPAHLGHQRNVRTSPQSRKR